MTQIDIAALVADREAGTKGRFCDRGTDHDDWSVDYDGGNCAYCFVGPNGKRPVAIILTTKYHNRTLDADARRFARLDDLETGYIAQDAELKRLWFIEGVMHGIANELSWSPKTREISDRIRAALGEKP